MDLTLINLTEPTETRTFEKGRFEVYRVGPMTFREGDVRAGVGVVAARGGGVGGGDVRGGARGAGDQRPSDGEDGGRGGAGDAGGGFLLCAAGARQLGGGG